MEDVPLSDPEPIAQDVRPRTERWRFQLGLGDRFSIEEDQARYAELSVQYASCFAMNDASNTSSCAPQEQPASTSPLAPPTEPPIPLGEDSPVVMDPLTAMVQAEEARTAKETAVEQAYRTERARRNRGLDTGPKIVDEEPDDVAAHRQLISNDLVRLSPVFESSPARIDVLARVLMVFAMEHTSMGYLQGMHEIASFVLYAIELEWGTDESDQQRREAECYAMTEAILTKIAASYDTDPNEPLTLQSQRVLQLTGQWPALHQRLRAAFCHIPSQLVFTKWMRLLFGREVVSHTLVLTLWDAIFEVEGSLQTTIEALAAARLLQHGQHVLVELNDDDALLQWFMNIPPEATVDVWVRRMRVLLQLEPPFDSPPPLPQSINPSMDLSAQRQGLAYPARSPQHARSNGVSPTLARSTNNNSSWDLSHLTTSFTDTLAAQTQSISKLITQEWDSMQQQTVPQRPLRTTSAEKYNLDYYPRGEQQRSPTQPPTLGGGGFPSTAMASDPRITPGGVPASALSNGRSLPDRLQHNVMVLQQFAMNVEQQAGMRVPPHVWTALADLQAVQGELKTRTSNG